MPFPPRSRPVGLLVLVAVAILAVACQRRPEPPAANQPTAAAPVPAAQLPPILPIDERLSRPELLMAAGQAASAAAAGQPAPKSVLDLSGQAFRIAIPVGCAGPSAEGDLRYSLDATAQTLRVSAHTESLTGSPFAEALKADGKPEAIEGFWIRRPWLRTETCPAGSNGGTPAAAETLGLAQVFEAGGSRLLRRGGRPYEATVKLKPGQTLSPGDLRLVLEGRLISGEGGAVRCHLRGPDAPPVCLILVEFTRVAFEGPAREILAEWTS